MNWYSVACHCSVKSCFTNCTNYAPSKQCFKRIWATLLTWYDPIYSIKYSIKFNFIKALFSVCILVYCSLPTTNSPCSGNQVVCYHQNSPIPQKQWLESVLYKRCSVKFRKIHKKKYLCVGPFHDKVARCSIFVKKYSSTVAVSLRNWQNTVLAEKVTNYLFDHVEYENDSDQTQWNTRAYCYE